MADTAAQTQRSLLDYQYIKDQNPNWSTPMINDYQNILTDWVLTAEGNDSLDGRVTTNTENITLVTDAFDTHNLSATEHGVNGNNIGTEDFCTEILGGAVLLSQIVSTASASSATIILDDILAAPGAYNQAYTQTLADMANDTKAKHNTLLLNLNSVVTLFNDLINKAKTAQQMNIV